MHVLFDHLESNMSFSRILSSTLFATACASVLLPMSACAQRNSGAYPDTTVESHQRADAIRADGERRKEAVIKERDDKIQAVHFQEKQAKEKARQEREAIALNRDKLVQPVTASSNEAKLKAEREQEAISDDAKIRTRTLDGAAATAVTTEADEKRAEIGRKLAADQLDYARQIDKAEATAREQTAKVDSREATEAAETQRHIDELTREARQKQLAIDQETSDALTGLSKDSTKRVSKSHEDSAAQLETDRRIAKDVRAELDRDHATYNTTTVSVKDGVVSLGGDVPSESARAAANTRATQTKGVVRVEDHLRVTSR